MHVVYLLRLIHRIHLLNPIDRHWEDRLGRNRLTHLIHIWLPHARLSRAMVPTLRLPFGRSRRLRISTPPSPTRLLPIPHLIPIPLGIHGRARWTGWLGGVPIPRRRSVWVQEVVWILCQERRFVDLRKARECKTLDRLISTRPSCSSGQLTSASILCLFLTHQTMPPIHAKAITAPVTPNPTASF